MANSKFLDLTGVGLVWAKVKLLLADKVDKVDGKGLSSNDYTAEEKAKLANIASGAEVNVNADWNAVTGDAAIFNKPTIPSKTSDLTNDSGYITSSDVPEGSVASTTIPAMDGTAAAGVETAFARGDHVHPKDTSKADLASPTFTGTPSAPTAAVGTKTTQIATTAFVDAAITDAIGDLEGVSFSIVQALPVSGDSSIIYLVADANAETNNAYEEYIWLSGSSKFEKIGTTAVDLSNYYNTTNLVAITSAEIDIACT